MRKLRWAMDGGFWDLDMSTPRTLEGQSRAVPRDPLPLGISRGTRLTRHKQVDFFQRFMFAPFVPQFSSSSYGASLHRVLTLPLTQNWFVALLGQFNVQKFISSLNESREAKSKSFKNIRRKLRDKSLYALGFCSEMLLTPDTALLLSLDAYGDSDATRKKAVLHQKFVNHDLTVEAVSPGLFVDKMGNYWDVPFSLAADVASLPSDLGTSYHVCLHHNAGWPELFGGDKETTIPATILPGTSVKGAFAMEKTTEIWRSKAQKLKLVQPYDAFLSNPHISASGIIGAAVTACFGDNSVRSQVPDESHDFTGLSLSAPSVKFALLADIFATASCTAQYGNFQKMFLDLTRSHVRLDFPSGAKFLLGAKQVVQDLINSQQPTLEALQTMCPDVTVSLQQQIAGPFSLRVDSGVKIDLRDKELPLRVHDPVFAIEYALQVLGSAKAVAWYSPKQREFMVELRFFET